MRNRFASTGVLRLLLVSFATLVFAQPAAALNADYWRGGWRTPLGDEPHIYYFVIRGIGSPARTAGLLRRHHDWLHRRHVGREGGHQLHGHVCHAGRQRHVCRQAAGPARRGAADCDAGRGKRNGNALN